MNTALKKQIIKLFLKLKMKQFYEYDLQEFYFYFSNYDFKHIVYYDQLYSSQLQEKAQKRNLRIKK